ncbi:hypothetical protein SDC9_124468 [bioreactor metagenome]|uniref:Secretion system C-terminal sorting domain-containing protein n=1 Tax=bioreactor metagenome TaxID=1076179 RepID=A0A645CKJ9_9ZZZZ
MNIAQPNAGGILVNGTGTGYIQSEGEANRVAWHINNGTGNYVIPFGAGGTKINMSYNVTGAGSASGTLIASTYATAINNTPYPSVYAPAVTTMDSTGFVGTNSHSLYTADRFWILRDTDRPWATKPTSTLTFTYRDAEFAPGNTITETELLAQYWNNTQWNPGWYTGSALLGVNNAASNQVNSINSGSNGNLYTWILVARQHPLPVELSEFSASCSPESKPVVTWATMSETNNAFFTLLRSTDGFFWNNVSVISGAGNSNEPLYYEFTDINAPEGELYYKLLQEDFDGSITEYGVTHVDCNVPEHGSGFGLNVYSDDEHQIHVTFNTDIAGRFVFRLFDIRGRLVYNEEVSVPEGLNHYILQIPPVEDATYMFNLTGSSGTESKKFLLQ